MEDVLFPLLTTTRTSEGRNAKDQEETSTMMMMMMCCFICCSFKQGLCWPCCLGSIGESIISLYWLTPLSHAVLLWMMVLDFGKLQAYTPLNGDNTGMNIQRGGGGEVYNNTGKFVAQEQ